MAPTDLEFYINEIKERICVQIALPQWKSILITERLGLQPDKVISLSKDQVWTPNDYKGHFNKLVTNGYGWINLHVYGVLNDNLILEFDWPTTEPGNTPVASVNLSGPENWIKDQRYRLSEFLELS